MPASHLKDGIDHASVESPRKAHKELGDTPISPNRPSSDSDAPGEDDDEYLASAQSAEANTQPPSRTDYQKSTFDSAAQQPMVEPQARRVVIMNDEDFSDFLLALAEEGDGAASVLAENRVEYRFIMNEYKEEGYSRLESLDPLLIAPFLRFVRTGS